MAWGLPLKGIARNRLEKEALALIEATGYPYVVTSMGKGSVYEHLSTFGGIYGGGASFPEIISAIEGSDCVLCLGNYPICIPDYSCCTKLIRRSRVTSIRELPLHFLVAEN